MHVHKDSQLRRRLFHKAVLLGGVLSSNGYGWFKVAEVDYDNFIGAPLVELIRSVYERSVPSDLIRGWLPVRARKTCQ